MDFPTTPGMHDVESRLADGRVVRYSVSVPAGAAPAGERPLALVLHYGGTPTRFYGRPLLDYLFEPALRPLAPVCIAPEVLRGQWSSEENEAFVMQLLDAARAAYTVTPARTVLCGYSMGAMGTWHLLERYPEAFSAAVPVAGFPQADLDTTIPVHAFHSAADELFPLEKLEAQVARMRAAGRAVELTLHDVNGHFDVNGYAPALAVLPEWLRGVWSRAARGD